LSAYLKLRAGQSLTPMEQLLTDIGTTRSLVAWQYVYGEFRAGLIDEADIPLENWRYVVSTRPELKVALENAGIVGLRPDFVQWMEENVVGR
jgi:hypothetical protein